MAMTQFVFGMVSRDAADGQAMVVGSGVAETLTPTSNGAQTSQLAPTQGGGRNVLVRVTTDVQVYVSFGKSPDAATDALRYLMPAGAIEYFYCQAGSKASVVLAS